MFGLLGFANRFRISGAEENLTRWDRQAGRHVRIRIASFFAIGVEADPEEGTDRAPGYVFGRLSVDVEPSEQYAKHPRVSLVSGKRLVPGLPLRIETLTFGPSASIEVQSHRHPG